MPRRGLTLIELLVVLAILGLLAGAWLHAFQPSSAQRSARAYRSTVRAARLAAMAGTPTSVRWDAGRGAFLVRHGPDPCAGELRATLEPGPRVAVVSVLRDGVAWTPDGGGRACSGGGVYGGRVRFEGPADAWDVVVASTGRLRLEAAP